MSFAQKVAAVALRSGLDRLVQHSWKGVLIFNYHRIGTPTTCDDPDLYSCSVDDFERHVALLSSRFEIVPAGAADLDLERPGRRVAITVDDGYKDMRLAADVLTARGVPGTFFICTGFLDRPHAAWWDEIAWLMRPPTPRTLPPAPWLPEGMVAGGRSDDEVRREVTAAYKRHAGDEGERFLHWLADATGRERNISCGANQWLTWDDVRGLRDAGLAIGGHTVSHPVLAGISVERQREEIVGSLRRLREETGSPVDLFSYPVGDRASFSTDTIDLLAESGVRRAFSFYGGVNSGGADRWDFRRVGVFRTYTVDMIAAMAAMPGIFASPKRYE
ncbi:polysaccharide deacetylase family protein [Pseudonocardia charpentierae]|uniref:Polysaccharide deacetylase family protein n=1 Tax=Pseudonocardia charpentierae TaxID=3075545 RepID=A0ABU2NIV5_9PSEU|nr:polysaccharide deacetylase family protein [Pseudonocardia sp. DSM 45834]MDT0353502.1 polysaccharide deacetylase family protein [Pseudonocardia sp. DSM 45834]